MPERKNNAGALFRNEKNGNDKRPDYRGPCLVNGVPMKMSAWINESKNGTKYMAITFEPDDGTKGGKPSAGDGFSDPHEVDESGIPF